MSRKPERSRGQTGPERTLVGNHPYGGRTAPRSSGDGHYDVSSYYHVDSVPAASVSTFHMTDQFLPPNAPFASSNSLRSLSPRASNSPLLAPSDGRSSPSLSINYLPSKFSGQLFSRRRNAKNVCVPKRGGGREAFKANESRMPGNGDEDYDGIQGNLFGGDRGKRKLRWTKFKWILFVANTLLTIYSLSALIFCLLTWFLVWDKAEIVRVGNTQELIISTVAAVCGVVTSLIGWSGILLNNRSFLAVYTFSLWICFAFLVTPGYITYKKRTFNLDGKLNKQWSQQLGASGRLAIQNQLGCCGYFSSFSEATVSQSCYSRSTLPGCKGPYIRYARTVLERWYTVAFSLVPLQLFVMVSALLCSNHVTYRFGKGMTPKAYRLSMNSMAVIMDNYANQLAEQYGGDVASEILARSRSNIHVDSMGYQSKFDTPSVEPTQ